MLAAEAVVKFPFSVGQIVHDLNGTRCIVRELPKQKRGQYIVFDGTFLRFIRERGLTAINVIQPGQVVPRK